MFSTTMACSDWQQHRDKSDIVYAKLISAQLSCVAPFLCLAATICTQEGKCTFTHFQKLKTAIKVTSNGHSDINNPQCLLYVLKPYMTKE